jgi:hypothetical protein
MNKTSCQNIHRFSIIFFSYYYVSSSATTHEPQVMASTTTISTKKELPPLSSTSTDNTHVRCLPPPPTYRLTIADLFDTSTGGGKPRLDRLREHLIAEGRLEEATALMIIECGENLLRSESTLIDLEAPITGKNYFPLQKNKRAIAYS